MNQLFQSFQKNQQNGFNLQTELQNLARQIAPMGMTPEQIVRQKIQNGEMSMEQFQKFSAIADQITGRNRQ